MRTPPCTVQVRWFILLLLGLIFFNTNMISGQQAESDDSVTALQFTAKPQHHVAVLEGNNLVHKSVADPANFQLSENQDLAVIEADESVKRLPPSYQIPGGADMAGDKYLLPFKLLARKTDNSVVSLAVILINSTPMEIDDTGNHFEGKLVFRLLNRNNPTHPGEDLKDPVALEFYSQKLRVITPAKIELKRTNTSSPEIHCGGDRGLADSVDVKLVTEFKPEGYLFHMDIEPFLEIRSEKNTIRGMGIEQVKMTLLLQGTTRQESIAVSLDVSQGSAVPSEVRIHPGEPVPFNVRSAGLGEAVVSAHAPNIQTIEKRFTYVFPWLFILMALIGGLLGTLARTFLGTPAKLTLQKIVLGAVYGFIGAVAWYVLGINLLSFEVSSAVNEFGVLGFSALIALLATAKSTQPNAPQPD